MNEPLIYGFFTYSIINAITSGPGNLLALNTMTNYGWKKGKSLIWGIFFGYYVVQIICAFFVYGLCSFLPTFMEIMRYAGVVYIIWLAICIILSNPCRNDLENKSSFWYGFILQFVNIKIYLFGITALTTFIVQLSNDLVTLIAYEILIATLGSMATICWVMAGIALQRMYVQHFRWVNLILALLLIQCAYSIIAA